jgi:hypothetical protein
MLDVLLFFKSIVLFTAAALLIYALTPNVGIDFLLKTLAFAFGSAMLMPFIYPHIRGVRRGDEVRVVLSEQELPFSILYARSSAVASGNARIGGRIKVAFRDGSEEEGVVISYAGLFAPAKVKLLQKEIRVV